MTMTPMKVKWCRYMTLLLKLRFGCWMIGARSVKLLGLMKKIWEPVEVE